MTENEHLLMNQIAIMELLKSIDYKLTFRTQNSEDAATWVHSINRRITATKTFLSDYT